MKQFVNELLDKMAVASTFLVKDKVVAVAKNGKPYMNLRLMDRTGDVDAKVWDNVERYAETFQRDDFVMVRGTASLYMGKMQIVLKDITRCNDDEVALEDFMPVSAIPTKQLIQNLNSVIASLENRYLRKLMEAFCADKEFLSVYAKAPAAKGMHHVYLGGLLEHSLSVVRLVDVVAPLYQGVNRDLLVVGALLHDVGKVNELRYERSFDYTDEGRLLGHITIGVEMITERIGTIPDFPRELGMLLKHMLLAHHGQYEYGSPKRPKTLEAILLHYLDDMDSKVNGVCAHMNKERETTEGHWTSFHRMYNLNFYLGEKEEKATGLTDGATSVSEEPQTRSESPNLSLFE